MNRPLLSQTWARFASLLLLVGGFGAMAHQLIWTRRLVDALGASHETFARVIGLFFLGLAAGSAWATRFPSTGRSALFRTGVAEACVALLAIPSVFVPELHDTRLIQSLPWAASWWLPMAVLLPPSIAMGLVFPSVSACWPGFSHGHRWYAANILGGAIGILVTSWLLLPWIGLRNAGWVAIGTNALVAAMAFWGWHRFSLPHCPAPFDAEGTQPEPTPAVTTLPRSPPPFLVAAATTGGVVMASEVILQHQLSQVTLHSYFSGAGVLFCVLVALFLGAVFPWHRLRSLPGVGSTRLLGALTALVLALQPVGFLLLRPNLTPIPHTLSPSTYHAAFFLLGMAVVVPALFLAGGLFPSLIRTALTRPSGHREVALLFAVNGLGGWLGTVIALELLLPRLGLWGGMPFLGLVFLMGCGSLSLGPHPRPRERRRWKSLLRGASLVLLLVGGMLVLRRVGPPVSRVPGERILEARTGRDGVVAVVHRDPDNRRIVFNNTYTLGGSKAQVNQERQAHLPLLLHGDPRQVTLLGLATGGTTAGAAIHPSVRSVIAIELSEDVAHMARLHFPVYNRSVMTMDPVEVIVGDARQHVRRHPGQADVIVGDLFLPWRTGEGRMYAREHFEAVRTALAPGGLFCQWLPLFQLTERQFHVIADTFRSVFDAPFLVRGDFYGHLPIVGLCGFSDGRRVEDLRWDRIEQACNRLRQGPHRVVDPLVRHVEGVAMMVIGPLPSSPGSASGRGPVLNTLENAWLEWDAGRNVVGLREPWFIGVPWAEYARSSFQSLHPSLAGSLAQAHEAGQFFVTLEIASWSRSPSLESLIRQAVPRLPLTLRSDFQADWDPWPGRHKPRPTRTPSVMGNGDP